MGGKIPYDERVILIGCHGNKLPYYGLEGDELVGPGIEFTKLIFDELGYDYEFVVMPWSRLLSSMENGEIDVLLDTILTEDRQNYLDYSEFPYLIQIDKFYALKTSDIPYDGSFGSIKGYKVGVVHDFSYGKLIDDAMDDGEFNFEETSNYEDNIDKLRNGRVDLIITNTLAAGGYITDDEIVSLEPYISMNYSFVTFSKANELARLRDEYDKVYEALVRSGTIAEMLEVYNLSEIGDSIEEYVR
nr:MULTISPECIES: transporter substrate-binding domain-containing protein [unclassified Fusibacter]